MRKTSVENAIEQQQPVRVFCHNCGTAQSDDAAFCAQCGAKQLHEPTPAHQTEAAPIAEGSQPRSAPETPSSERVPFDRVFASRMRSGVFWIVTVSWIALSSLYAYASWGRLSQLQVHEIADLVIRAIAPLVLFWLAMAYFQLAARVRHTESLTARAATLVSDTEKAATLVSDLTQQAQSVLQRVQSEAQRLRAQEKQRMRGLQPRWEVSGRIAHEKVHEINLRNVGAAASGLNVASDKSLNMAVLLSETSLVERGGMLTVKAMFLDNRRDDFELKLQYSDGANQPRVAHIAVSNMEVTVRHDEV